MKLRAFNPPAGFRFQFNTEPVVETKPLKIQSSVYPEGHGTLDQFNDSWKTISNESFKMYRERNIELN